MMVGEVSSLAKLVGLAEEVGTALASRGLTCSLAESCTGGLVGHLLTEISGSSAYFMGSAVVYSYSAKERVVGVEHDALLAQGAVSAEIARQLAQGALRLYAVDVAVSITGVAGPEGGTPEKPVGTVYLHLSAADGTEEGRHFVWPADRSGNKLLSAEAALYLLLEYAGGRDRSG
jgi:PncC family amidohydrolase